MDMQNGSISNLATLDVNSTISNSTTTTDLWVNGTMNLNGTLLFNAGSAIYINGAMIDPTSLINISDMDATSDIRITQLETENKTLRVEMDTLKEKMVFLEKWVQV